MSAPAVPQAPPVPQPGRLVLNPKTGRYEPEQRRKPATEVAVVWIVRHAARLVGGVESHLYRWFDAADAINARKARITSPVPAPTPEQAIP